MKRICLIFSFFGLLTLAGCSVDGLLYDTILGKDHGPAIIILEGTYSFGEESVAVARQDGQLDAASGETSADSATSAESPVVLPEFLAYDAEGNSIEILNDESIIEAGHFEIHLKPVEEGYKNLWLMARFGNREIETLLPEVPYDKRTDVGNLGADSTVKSLIAQASVTLACQTLALLDLKLITELVAKIETLSADPAMVSLAEMYAKLLAAGTTPAPNDLWPLEPYHYYSLSDDLAGGLNKQYILTNKIDLNGDGKATSKDIQDFTALVRQLVSKLSFAVPSQIPYMRVVLTVNFNEGIKDDNCQAINRTKWLKPKPGNSMFFTGGVHTESPIRDDDINKRLGGWVPNIVPMYDDGTNGDFSAGDGIWTITFDLPVGMRIGYKYTWGANGDLWTGTEEWPGNQRILEVVDVNGDRMLIRNDNFGDETTNKDLVNLNWNGSGSVTWTTDVSGMILDDTGSKVSDGIPDTRERMADTNDDCLLDTWVTPANITPIAGPCD
jgi:hypothetical protein